MLVLFKFSFTNFNLVSFNLFQPLFFYFVSGLDFIYSKVGKFAYQLNNLFYEFYFVDNQDKKSILINFGENLRKLRLSKGFTQEQLANELGIEISQISRIERGVINTSVTTLYAISKTLQIDVSELFAF